MLFRFILNKIEYFFVKSRYTVFNTVVQTPTNYQGVKI